MAMLVTRLENWAVHIWMAVSLLRKHFWQLTIDGLASNETELIPGYMAAIDCCASLFSRPLSLSSALAQAAPPTLSNCLDRSTVHVLEFARTNGKPLFLPLDKARQQWRVFNTVIPWSLGQSASQPRSVRLGQSVVTHLSAPPIRKSFLNCLMLRKSNLFNPLSLSTITIPPTATHVAGTSFRSTATNGARTSFSSTTTNVAGTHSPTFFLPTRV
uniref:Uncharacterized protein n=1 Tax=Timema bartmani TaxID=61472 RepID=A0A7R9F2Y7_9NEOP|nr:unnamed protein product [Timema bartmani]